jgi:hypothetical protein
MTANSLPAPAHHQPTAPGLPGFGWSTPFAKLLLVLLLPLTGAAGHALTYLVLAAMALSGPRRAIEALTLAWLVTFLNPGIYSLSPHAEGLRWLVVVCALAGSTTPLFFRNMNVPAAALWLLAFMAGCAGLALGVSYAPDVALFKLASFAIVVGTILMGYHAADVPEGVWERWFLTLFAVVIMFSLPLVVHDTGYFRNGRGFQGILNHPQALGVFVGAMLPWVVVLGLSSSTRRWWWWMLVSISGLYVILIQSRTSAIAVLGTLATVSIWWLLRRKGSARIAARWSVRLAPVMIAVAVVAWSQRDAFVSSVQAFVFKAAVDVPVQEAFHLSRGFLIAESMRNFRDHPIGGIGFGLPSSEASLAVQRDPFLGLPIGAPAEKGFLITAALEEIGLAGSALFLILLVSWLTPAAGRKVTLAAAALAAGALFVNLGEAVLFSAGGMGLLMWLLLGAARSFGRDHAAYSPR